MFPLRIRQRLTKRRKKREKVQDTFRNILQNLCKSTLNTLKRRLGRERSRSGCCHIRPILDKMRKKAKKLLFTTETHEVFVIRTGHEKMRAFCDGCRREVEMVSLDTAVDLTRNSARSILRAIENREIHSHETVTGHLLVCGESLKGEVL